MEIETSNNIISIIVPVYNVREYLRECLDSILGQTYRNIEILLVDDGSTDGSGGICDEYAAKDSRVRVFHIENHGISFGRNYALDRVTGSWVGFVDSDDWIEPDMYEKLLNAALSSATFIAACSRSIDYVDTRSSFARADVPAVLQTREETAEAYFTGKMLGNVVWERIYRREVFDSGLRFTVGRSFEDIYISTAIIARGWTISYIPDLLYHYRQRKTSEVHIRGLKKWVDRWAAVDDQKQVLAGIIPDFRKYLIWNCVFAASSVWEHSAYAKKEEREKYAELYEEIAAFSQQTLNGPDNSLLRRKDRTILSITRKNSIPAYNVMYALRRINLFILRLKQGSKDKLFD